MSNPFITRAQLLLQQGRFSEAEQQLRKALAASPDSVTALYLLSVAFGAQGKAEEAERTVKAALQQEPDDSMIIHQYARVLFMQDKYKEALEQIDRAIEGEPDEASHFGLKATIQLNRKDLAAARASAEAGLALDPENLNCLNVRSMALIKLGRKEEAYQTMEKALEEDPENEFTHSTMGWNLLEQGDHKKALEHFREALKLNPNFPPARSGLVEALKARYLFYRLWLKYAFWVSNLKGNIQWFLLIGLYVGYRFVLNLAESNPALRPLLYPLIALYILFALTTWIINPLTNLVLRLNKYGRYALEDSDIQTSNLVGGALIVAILGGLGYLFTQSFLSAAIAIYGLTMMIPMSSMIRLATPGIG